jgi:hypothetical protein
VGIRLVEPPHTWVGLRLVEPLRVASGYWFPLFVEEGRVGTRRHVARWVQGVPWEEEKARPRGVKMSIGWCRGGRQWLSFLGLQRVVRACVEKLRTVLPLTVGIRDGVVQLVLTRHRVWG